MASAHPQADPVFPEEETFSPHPLETRWGVPGKPGLATVLALPQSWASRRVHDSPPTPSVANRGCLVPAPIELPCSLHTKNGNPQAILGALPSQAVATVHCFHRAAGPSSKPTPSPAHSGPASGAPCREPWLEGANLDPGKLWEQSEQADWQLGGGRGWAMPPGHRQVGEVSQLGMHALSSVLYQSWCSWLETIQVWERWLVSPGFRWSLQGWVCEESRHSRSAKVLGMWGTSSLVTSFRTIPPAPHPPALLCSALQERR